MNQNKTIVYIFWGQSSPASEDFARALGAILYKIHFLRQNRPLLAPIKYIPMFLKTLWILFRKRPTAVFVVNTPVFAPLCVFFYCRFARIPFVMDIHGHSFIGWKWAWSAPLQSWLARRALANMIDHSEHRRIFESWKANIFMLERPPIVPPVNGEKSVTRHPHFIVTVINTFAGDEPLGPVIKAARKLPDIRFFILGDKSKAENSMLREVPANVTFPGYLLSNNYWSQLYASNAIMTLTNTPYSLVSGGIEGMAVGKPLILSRQPALTDYFTKGTIFVDHSAESIFDALRQIITQEDRLKREIAELAVEKRERWSAESRKLLHLIGAENCKTQ